MILYDLRCKDGHSFEGWFRDSAGYDQQAKARKIICPVCGSKKVEKALMAPRLARSRRGESKLPAKNEKMVNVEQAEMLKALRGVRKQIEDNCDYVGERFPEEARKIHYGETEQRGIYGEASDTEAEALKDEGITVNRVPWVPPADN
ncbi:MAG: DUF1178 family protein [Proteobacteria bacterium]|nr:DUF1178 family protein [Pseudomonadota bacterium]MBI3496494.1 DUF1178 family protein [Pseudomonadota bacterium]